MSAVQIYIKNSHSFKLPIQLFQQMPW